MIRAALFEARYPGNFAAQVETVIEEQACIAAVDHLCTVRCQYLRRGHGLKRCNLTCGQACATLQEHARIDVARYLAARVSCHMVERIQQRPHMIPVAV